MYIDTIRVDDTTARSAPMLDSIAGGSKEWVIEAWAVAFVGEGATYAHLLSNVEYHAYSITNAIVYFFKRSANTLPGNPSTVKIDVDKSAYIVYL